MAQGMSNREIADRLVISRRTAEHHVQDVYLRIGVSTRAAAALFAMEHGLLDRTWVGLPMPARATREHSESMTTTSTARASGPRRLFTGSFVLLTAADLAYFTAVGIAIYALPLYVTGPLGSDMAGAGIAFGAFAVSALLLRPLRGPAQRHLGTPPLLIGGAVLAAPGLALTADAETLPAVIGPRLLLGVAEAVFFVASFAALADLAPPAGPARP